MSSQNKKRPYRLRRRAEEMEHTRGRIAKAAFELHGTVGPAQTTIAAIADRAGVQRATVYRHFPDDLSLFRACVAHGYRVSPAPDPEPWLAERDPEERLRVALGDLFAYFRANEPLWLNVLRDLPGLPALQRANAELGTFALRDRMKRVLLAGWGARGRRKRLIRAAIGHAIDFRTWHSLVREQGLDDEEAADVCVRMVRALAGTRLL